MTEISTDPVESAKAAGLRYVSDADPGIGRKRAGRSFSYVGLDGKPIRDRALLQRIRSLGIPPAWTDVWICPVGSGHIQATGRDAKGRKQYRYHARWREVRDETKYERMMAFARALPLIRKRVDRDMGLPGLPREKVLATVIGLLETTHIRVGNEEYVRQNRSFGLTTMRTRHVDVSGSTMRFEFKGKSGKRHSIELKDRRLANMVKRFQELPGQELFQYVDDEGARHTIDSQDVNDYLGEITDDDFTAKDFRTWAGTVFAAMALLELGACDSEAEARKNVARAIESVAERLGNTVAICRKCYVHPIILDAYLDGSLTDTLKQWAGQEMAETPGAFRSEEAAVLAFLQKRLARQGD